MTANSEPERYPLKEVRIRLAEGAALYSDVPLSSPRAALDVMRKELAQLDREVLCVVNLNTRLKPINFNIVSMGTINESVTAIPNILKSGILSNAYGFLLLHNHPSGDVTPSEEDIRTTRRCIEAGKLMDIPCLDHIIVGSGNGWFLSLRESGTVDFTNEKISMTAAQILRTGEKIPIYDGGSAGKGNRTMAEEKMMEQSAEQEKREEISIRFAKGLAEPFTSKDGKEYIRVKIPNEDLADKTPWASFVLPAKNVHENQHGKGLWAKIAEDGTTLVTKPALAGQDEAGKNIWNNAKIPVPNRELKAMVESYMVKAPQAVEAQPRESVLEKLESLKKEAAARPPVEKPRTRAKAKGPEL